MSDSEKQLHQRPLPVEEPDGEGEDENFANNYGVAIALGIPLGMIFGLLVLDNIAYGLLIGTALAPIIALFMGKWNKN